MDDELLTQRHNLLLDGPLTDEALLARVDQQPTIQILPDANVIKIGGQSIIDRGRAAVFPVLKKSLPTSSSTR